MTNMKNRMSIKECWMWDGLLMFIWYGVGECKNWEMKKGIGSMRLANISLSNSKNVAKYFKDNF